MSRVPGVQCRRVDHRCLAVRTQWRYQWRSLWGALSPFHSQARRLQRANGITVALHSPKNLIMPVKTHTGSSQLGKKDLSRITQLQEHFFFLSEETEKVALISKQRGKHSRLVPQGLCPPLRGGSEESYSVWGARRDQKEDFFFLFSLFSSFI